MHLITGKQRNKIKKSQTRLQVIQHGDRSKFLLSYQMINMEYEIPLK